MRNGYIASGSANIYYELYGEENTEVLVLLHGNGESIKFFKHQINFFSKYYKVLAIDSRGHGESGFGSGTLSLNAMAVDLFNVANQLGFDSINVLGFSDGANVAMLTAIKESKLIKNMVLVGGNMNMLGFKLGTMLTIYAAYLCSMLAGVIDKNNRLNSEFLALMVKEPALSSDDLSCIEARTLVMAGDNDMIREGHTKKIAASIPNAKIKILEGDHFFIFKNPDEANKVILDFFQG